MKSNAMELAMELEGIILRINDTYEDTARELKRLDMMRQDILHQIEGTSFNASEGYKYSKALQLISKERRNIKYEHKELETLRARVGCYAKQILKSTNEIKTLSVQNEALKEQGIKRYNPRVIRVDKTDVVNQVLEILNSEE